MNTLKGSFLGRRRIEQLSLVEESRGKGRDERVHAVLRVQEEVRLSQLDH